MWAGWEMLHAARGGGFLTTLDAVYCPEVSPNFTVGLVAFLVTH